MQVFKRYILIWMIFLMAFIPTAAMALKTTVTGQVEAKAILRDTDGFQHGFLNDYNEFIMARTVLKIDVTLAPEYTHRPAFRLDKVNMIYKGGYDAVYDLSDRYDNLPVNVDSSEGEFGKDDLRFENDMKEIYADFVYQRPNTSTTMRLGRQIVQWGEDTGHAISNVIVPTDLRYAPVGSNPEEFATPLWMARMDHNIAGVGPLDELGFQLILIPEFKPLQFPLGDDPNGPSEWWTAPYASGFAGLSAFDEMQEVLPSDGLDNMQVAAKVSFTVGELHMETSYFDGYQQGFAMNLHPGITKLTYMGVMGAMTGLGAIPATDAASIQANLANPALNAVLPAIGMPNLLTDTQMYEANGTLGKVLLEHPTMENWAISGNYYSEMLHGVIAFETAGSFNQSFGHAGDGGDKGYSNYDMYQFYLSYGRDFTNWAKYIGTTQAVSTTISAYHRYIAGYDEDTSGNSVKQNNTAFGLALSTGGWDAGRIAPSISFEYDTEGVVQTVFMCTFVRGRAYAKIMTMPVWGRTDASGAQKHGFIDESEISFVMGYNF
jgi:hypothetical protein